MGKQMDRLANIKVAAYWMDPHPTTKIYTGKALPKIRKEEFEYRG